MEHATITTLDNGMLNIVPDAGYRIYDRYANRTYSTAVVASLDGITVVPEGISPEPHEPTLDDAKAAKLAALKAYDASAAVNAFYINGEAMWLTPAVRDNYLNSLQSAQRLGQTVVPFLGQTLAIETAIQMLDAVNLYAMQCVAVTDSHAAAIRALDTIAAVEAYDYTVGYPAKLNF